MRHRRARTAVALAVGDLDCRELLRSVVHGYVVHAEAAPGQGGGGAGRAIRQNANGLWCQVWQTASGVRAGFGDARVYKDHAAVSERPDVLAEDCRYGLVTDGDDVREPAHGQRAADEAEEARQRGRADEAPTIGRDPEEGNAVMARDVRKGKPELCNASRQLCHSDKRSPADASSCVSTRCGMPCLSALIMTFVSHTRGGKGAVRMGLEARNTLGSY